ncbi:hypothetical protein WJX82_009802 [Trebouxia sp. C0006]
MALLWIRQQSKIVSSIIQKRLWCGKHASPCSGSHTCSLCLLIAISSTEDQEEERGQGLLWLWRSALLSFGFCSTLFILEATTNKVNEGDTLRPGISQNDAPVDAITHHTCRAGSFPG